MSEAQNHEALSDTPLAAMWGQLIEWAVSPLSLAS